MLIWSGGGIWVAVVLFFSLLCTQLISGRITGDEHYYQDHPWLVLVGMLAAAAVTHMLNRSLLRPEHRTVIDKETGQEMVLSREHSLFFISTKWWPVILIVIGVIYAVTS